MSNEKSERELQTICSDLILEAINESTRTLVAHQVPEVTIKIAALLVSSAIKIITFAMDKRWHQEIHGAVLNGIMDSILDQVETMPENESPPDPFTEDNPFSKN